MGGVGSGRSFQSGAATTNELRSIDVRWLKRCGILDGVGTHNVTWSLHGKEVASIKVINEGAKLVFDYRHRRPGKDWTPERYTVHLTNTPCNMGGERTWFRCPALGCGRRVAILYGGTIFACRRCFNLKYASQREDPINRATRRADRLRERLEWPPGILNGSGWGKPKGMHWKTYHRLSLEHDHFVDRSLAGFHERFGRLAIDLL